MFARKKPYYHIDDKPKVRGNNKKRTLSLLVAFCLMGVGAYVFVLLQSPEILATEAAADEETALVQSDENFIKIERINLLVPFYTGDSEATLEKGAWHRFPERGDPENGGNFIISAHRFRLGVTPNDTKEKSPFYHIDKLQNDDIIDVFYDKQWYSYRITKTFSVKPEAIEIEKPSDEAKLTLYSCTLQGSADGRVVIEATPVAKPGSAADNEAGGALLL